MKSERKVEAVIEISSTESDATISPVKDKETNVTSRRSGSSDVR